MLAQVKAGVAAVRSSADWAAWLRTAASFVNYSFGNTWLIAAQCPGARQVAGFHTWKGLGRTVKKGERGIAILAPVSVKRDSTSPATGEVTQKRVMYFKTVYVFELDQTEGTDLPVIARTLEGSADDQLAQLTSLAQDLGFTVTVKVLRESLGGFVDAAKQITLNSDKPSRHRARTLIHELAHGLLGHPGSDALRERQELEAETTAWIVAQQLGLEPDEYSFGYLAAWCGRSEDFGSQLEAAAEKAFKAARLILGALAEVDAKAA